jgi:hypothetical protein
MVRRATWGAIQIINLANSGLEPCTRFCRVNGTKLGQEVLSAASVLYSLNLSMLLTMPILGQFQHLTDPTHPSPPFFELSPERLITVLQTQYKNPRIFVKLWTTEHYEHLDRQSWIGRCSIRIVGGGVPLQKSSLT